MKNLTHAPSILQRSNYNFSILALVVPVFSLGICMVLGGCSGLLSPPSAPPRIMTLMASKVLSKDVSHSSSKPHQIVVTKPLCPNSLNNARVALQESPHELTYYAGIVWEDKVPLMVQTHLARSLETMGLFQGVGVGDNILQADRELQSDIQSFQIISKEGNPKAQVALNLKLVSLPGRALLSQKFITHTMPLEKENFASIAEAFEGAFMSLEKEMGTWLRSVF